MSTSKTSSSNSLSPEKSAAVDSILVPSRAAPSVPGTAAAGGGLLKSHTLPTVNEQKTPTTTPIVFSPFDDNFVPSPTFPALSSQLKQPAATSRSGNQPHRHQPPPPHQQLLQQKQSVSPQQPPQLLQQLVFDEEHFGSQQRCYQQQPKTQPSPTSNFHSFTKHSSSASNLTTMVPQPSPSPSPSFADTGSGNVSPLHLDNVVSPTNSVSSSTAWSDAFNNGSDNDNSRDVIIRVRTEEREAEYTRYERYRIFVGTWNVNGQVTSEETAMRDAYLGMDEADHQPPDFYAIGFQELDLSREAYLFDNYQREQFWLRLVTKSLHPKASYEMIKSDRLIGMMLVIFARKELVPFINNIEASHVGTGILGKMGNKGGVAIRFDLHETSLCFVNCHLAAHVEQFERRNQDFKEIRNRLLFPQPFKAPRRIDDHNQIYWFGDLNYRVMYLSTEQIKEMLDRGEYEVILENDQLKRQKDLRNCFEGYQEGPIHFSPSYKYNPGTDDWDSSEKRRPPAWCDRVLWRGPRSDITQLAYRSHPQLKASDHKPVSALFLSSFRITDQAAKRKVYEDVMKRLDKEENDYLPAVEIETTEINFGVVRFKDAPSRSLRVKNVGQSKIKYQFITKPNETSYCKDWLRITPASASIARGETVEIRLELSFEVPATYIRLNYGLEKLSDTLVLRLLGGKDIFITVSGDYRPSAFGCMIETLISLKERALADIDSPEELAASGGAQWDEAVKRALDPLKSAAYPAAKQNPVNNKATAESSSSNVPVDLLIDLSFDDPPTKTKTAQQQFLELSNFEDGSNDPLQPLQQKQQPKMFKELYMLVDYIYKNGVVKRDLFQNSGSEMDFVRIREALDHACPDLLKDISVDSVAEALLLFLHSLPEPVIPYRFYERVVANRSNFSNCQQVIADLPDSHRCVFEYLILFLKELLSYSAMNKLNPTVVAKIFGSILLRKPESTSHGPSVHEHYTTTISPGVGTLRTSPGRLSAMTRPSGGGRSAFYVQSSSTSGNAERGGSLVTTSNTSLGSLGSSSSSSSSSSSDLGGQVTLNPEQTFIYHFLCNSLD